MEIKCGHVSVVFHIFVVFGIIFANVYLEEVVGGSPKDVPKILCVQGPLDIAVGGSSCMATFLTRK